MRMRPRLSERETWLIECYARSSHQPEHYARQRLLEAGFESLTGTSKQTPSAAPVIDDDATAMPGRTLTVYLPEKWCDAVRYLAGERRHSISYTAKHLLGDALRQHGLLKASKTASGTVLATPRIDTGRTDAI